MKNLNMFCVTMSPKHENFIQKLGYVPVGLGDKDYSDNFLTDRKGINIAKKNPFYGEYTFHYWLWKNKINELDNKWIGFCQYRKFWCNNNYNKQVKDFSNFENLLIKTIPNEYNSYESILGEPLFVNQFRLSKFIKNNLKTMIKKPTLFFNNKKRNLRFHFNMMHGHGNLSKAINLLDVAEKKDFEFFVDSSVSFNPHNMFICKSKEKLKMYYESLFPWLERCESEFGFSLDGYGLRRIYGFLAERYMSYWFQKYTKFKLMPIIFKDITDFE